MIPYRHTQHATLVIVAQGVFLLLLAILSVATDFHAVPLVMVGLVLVIAALFHSLRVEVTEEVVRLRFGVGLIRKQFDTDGIRAVSVVRNPWYYGWGIRLYPRGWLYNVSGLDAVELEMEDGRHFRIGTDEPEALKVAIETALMP